MPASADSTATYRALENLLRCAPWPPMSSFRVLAHKPPIVGRKRLTRLGY